MTTSVAEHWFEHRVSYGETDCMNVVYYANYLHIFERARGAFIRSLGISYAEVEKCGLFLPVREAQCRYRQPARYDDMLFVRTVVSELKRASVTYSYSVYANGKDTLITTGWTQHACVNAEGKPGSMPEWFRELCMGKPFADIIL